MQSRAQGTIEYLVIVAIIIVISLVVTTLLLNIGNNNTALISSNSSKLGNLTSGSISVVESAVDSTGDGSFYLKNLGLDKLNLVSVSSKDNPSQTYNATISDKGNGEYTVNVSDINSVCVCDTEGKIISCNLVIKVSKTNGITVSIPVTSTLCASDVTGAGTGSSGSSDITPPSVVLLSPTNGANSSTRTIDFDFNITDSSAISSCQLFIDGVGETPVSSGLANGQNTIQKTFTQDTLLDWNVSCTDANNNTGNSTQTFSLDVDANAYQITTCLELQEMNNDLSGNYLLMNNIDCSDTVNWNPILDFNRGFIPIGTSTSFSGSLDGNKHTISGLYVKRDWLIQLHSGLIGILSGTIRNLYMSDLNIIASGNAGGIAASASSGTIQKSAVLSGSLIGSGVGGLVGSSTSSTISDCYTSLDLLNLNGADTGGIIGHSVADHINRSYSSGNISSYSYTGGIMGYNNSNTSITNEVFSAGIISQSSSNTSYGGISGSGCNAIESYSVSSGPVSCGTIESNGASYFIGNVYQSQKHPFYPDWDFTNVWQENAGAFPTLR